MGKIRSLLRKIRKTKTLKGGRAEEKRKRRLDKRDDREK